MLMSYFALYLGIFLGFLLRIFDRSSSSLRTCRKRRRILSAVKNRILRKWKAFQKTLLANSIFYICAKTASICRQKGHFVRLLSCISVPDFCRSGRGVYTILEPRQKRPVCIPEIFQLTEQKVPFYVSPPIYVAELSNIRIIGGSSILLSRDNCLYDPAASDKEKRLDVKFSVLAGQLGERMIVEFSPPSIRINTGIFMNGFASYNYYHLTVEILSRLAYIDSMPQYDRIPLIVDEVMVQVPQYRKLLELCNRSARPLIPVPPGAFAEIKRLIFPSYNTWMPINVKKRNLIRPSDFLIAESALMNLKNCVASPREIPFRKIFLSRKNASAARLENETEIAMLFRQYGFEIVCPETLSLEKQISLFHQAKCVAGASGAALTNIIYCQPGTEVVCIIPKEHRFYMYSTIAYLLGQKPVYLNASITERTPYPASDLFRLDPEYCRLFLEENQK